MKLGMTSHGQKKSKRGKNGVVLAKANKLAAHQFAKSLRPTVFELMVNAGTSRKARSQKALAEALNAKNVATARGGRWHTETVRRLLKRLGPEFKQQVDRARWDQ